ncbi:hypothetical protein RQP53_16710 [Paucibacter sp. APW11]|uniref:GspL cytoplasmic actin-ATPase-like domain-containing protein n=1 Tax=Roseateles aquae TaxID=3077235 RepID=A0ABU3PEW8_9BURK|nr:hypothetical protein [Paucibacter sp. APW11]MDT9000920.1 hypothetical protein [Paucibacter sp. APW11]
MNSASSLGAPAREGQVLRWRRALRARLAQPQQLWLNEAVAVAALDGVGRAEPLQDWASQQGGTALGLIVSEQLIHPLLCEPGLPLHGDEALQAYGRQQFLHYFGAAAQRWPLAAWRQAETAATAETAGDPAAAGVLALHLADWPARLQQLQAQQIRLSSLRPAALAALQTAAHQQPDWWQAESAALAWVEGSLLSWLQLRHGRVSQWRHLRLAAASGGSLAETLAELMAAAPGVQVLLKGYGLDTAAESALARLAGLRVLGRLDAPAPLAAHFELPAKHQATLAADFVVQRPPRSPIAWPLLGCGLLVLATALQQTWQTHQAREQLQTLLDQQTQRQARLAPRAAASKPARSATSKAQEADDWRAAAEVQALLQHRWDALLANVEQAGAETAGAISWLGLDYVAGRRELRLEGLANERLPALKLVDRLAAAPGWQDVIVGRLQNGSQGLVGQRFELSAKIRPAALQAALPAVAAVPASGAQR